MVLYYKITNFGALMINLLSGAIFVQLWCNFTVLDIFSMLQGSRNPFHELITNPNTFQFADQIEKEYHPDNGWELLGRNFGSPSQGVQNPFFILYNRFTGIIRIFVNIKNTGNFAVNAATINFYFPTGTSRSAIFNQLGELTNAVNNFEPKAHSNKINQYVNSGVSDNYFWLYSDVLSLLACL